MAKIVVVGSLARDEVVRLDQRLVEGAHLSGRALPPRLSGGGANPAVALAHAGHEASLVSAVGGDEAGRQLLVQLAATGVSTAAVVEVPGPSTRSVVLVDGVGERTIVNLGRAREAEPPARLLGLACDLLYVRGREPTLAPLLAEMNRRCPVVAHVPPVAPGALPAQVLVGSASDLDSRFLDDPWAAGRTVAGDVLEWVVVTFGAAGARAYGRTGAVLAAEAPKVEPEDSTGAGDCFAAGLVHALAGGAAMAEALTVACRWGAEKVRCEGSTLTAEAVRRLLSS